MSVCGIGCWGKCCTNRKLAKYDFKVEKKEIKYDYKTEKSENKTDRTLSRQATKSIAYQHGIDPHAAAWGAVGKVGTAFAGAWGVRGLAGSLSGEGGRSMANMGNGSNELDQLLGNFNSNVLGASAGSSAEGKEIMKYALPVALVVVVLSLLK